MSGAQAETKISTEYTLFHKAGPRYNPWGSQLKTVFDYWVVIPVILDHQCWEKWATSNLCTAVSFNQVFSGTNITSWVFSILLPKTMGSEKQISLKEEGIHRIISVHPNAPLLFFILQEPYTIKDGFNFCYKKLEAARMVLFQAMTAESETEQYFSFCLPSDSRGSSCDLCPNQSCEILSPF